MPTAAAAAGGGTQVEALKKTALKAKCVLLEDGDFRAFMTKVAPEIEEELGFTKRIVEGVTFKAVIFMAVITNCGIMGLEVDLPQYRAFYDIMEHVFTVVFTIEFLMKFAAYHFEYFMDPWNDLDFSLCMLSILDAWILSSLGIVNGLQSMTILRTLRIVRLVRILRLIKRFRKFVLIMQGIIHAMHAAAWVGLLLTMVLYVSAIFFVGQLKTDGHRYPGYSTDEEDIFQLEVINEFNPHLYFGDMFSAMLTLFNMAVLAEWSEIVRPIMLLQPGLVICFIGFSLCVTFGMMNVIVGMIVDNVMRNQHELSQEESEMEAQEHLELLEEVEQAWNDLGNKDKKLDMSGLVEMLSDANSHLHKLIARAKLPSAFAAKELFNIIDENGDGSVTFMEFQSVMYRLLDNGPSEQLWMLQKSVNVVYHLLKAQAKEIEYLRSETPSTTSCVKAADNLPAAALLPQLRRELRAAEQDFMATLQRLLSVQQGATQRAEEALTKALSTVTSRADMFEEPAPVAPPKSKSQEPEIILGFHEVINRSSQELRKDYPESGLAGCEAREHTDISVEHVGAGLPGGRWPNRARL